MILYKVSSYTYYSVSQGQFGVMLHDQGHCVATNKQWSNHIFQVG